MQATSIKKNYYISFALTTKLLNAFLITLSSLLTFSCSAAGFDEIINNAIAPLSAKLFQILFSLKLLFLEAPSL